jgi:hypothetical protein
MANEVREKYEVLRRRAEHQHARDAAAPSA